MTTLYLIRHAEAEGNLYRRSQGQYDSNITPLGRLQIAAVAERFRDVPIDALWASDLTRTRSTAAAILRYHPHLTMHTTPRLREIDVGVWEDRPWGNITHEYPDQMYCFDNDPARWSVPGGEPFYALIARMKGVVLELAENYDGQTVAVVTHGLAVRALLSDLLGVPSAELYRLPYGDNTCVACLTAENGQLHVEYYNDASHLGELSTFARQKWRKTDSGKRIYSRFEPLDPEAEAKLYSRCYAETWMSSHGDLTGYSPVVYLRMAESHARQDSQCLMKLFYGERFAGIIELDPERGRQDDAGWISLLYVEPDMRQMRLGVQLLGHAVAYFRRLGRSRLRLHVSETNAAAIGFYEYEGFTKLGTAGGVGGTLYLMEKDITRHVITPEDLPDPV